MMKVPSSTSQLLEQLDEQGYVILQGILQPAVVAGVRNDMEEWVNRQAHQLRAQGVIDQLFKDEPFETRLIRLYANCPDRLPKTIRQELHLRGFFPLFFHRHLLDLAEARLGSEIRLYPNYSVRPKLPDHPATQVLWHQDAGYTASGQHGHDPRAGDTTADKLRMVNMWTPLVPARPENGCMQFIPRTHKLGLVPHLSKEHYLEIIDQEIQPRLKDAIDVILDPGDVVLFSNLLFHMGLPNRSKTVRWSCDWRYQDARQSTMRTEQGHIARSHAHPATEVKSAEQWTTLSFS
ncbi:MAG: hypothetical protein EXS39_06690 [Opitutaceae bacterium]|nr:hypothetical protein [Opitutaceae bacterium]